LWSASELSPLREEPGEAPHRVRSYVGRGRRSKLSWRSSLNQEELMNTATTPNVAGTPAEPVLYVAFEMSASEWKMGMSTGLGQQPRYRGVPARDMGAVQREIASAKSRFGLPADARVVSCYEAGRDGFWPHRKLVELGLDNQVVDSASIEVNRRARRAKSDRLDAGKLVGMLIRWHAGDERVWKVVRVPTVEEEDRRQLHRELKTVKKDRTRLTNRIKALLFAQGVRIKTVDELPRLLEAERMPTGDLLPQMLRERLTRDWAHAQTLLERVRLLEARRRELLRKAEDAGAKCAAKLVQLSGIGATTAWLFALEFFGWREFRNGKQIGGLAGLTPTPYQSGLQNREQGICKAGNRWIRGLAIETAWGWLRYQPESELSKWYERRFAHGGARLRKIGIVALARKLLIELWKYLETGTPPAGASLKAKVTY
jgi:transposase